MKKTILVTHEIDVDGKQCGKNCPTHRKRRRIMAQTEMMLRLLLDNQIVGFQLKIAYRIYQSISMPSEKLIKEDDDNIYGTFQSEEIKPYNTIGELLDNWERVTVDNEIVHNRFEQGIKMPDGTWWFSGDIVRWNNEFEGIIKFGHDYEYFIDFGQAGYTNLNTEYKCEIIGSIHEEKK